MPLRLSPALWFKRLLSPLYRAHWAAAARIDHADTVERVRADGQFTGRYGFMIIMSCGIASLGLLLSSPAVIIGAMLISPLMGPIVMLGFSLSILDLEAMRKSLAAVTLGVLIALGASAAIVTLSPLTQATAEILARTQPNLFDLLVAIFSGMAGGYAVINRKGETIVGVAIATALMPPLCVVGYGLATGSFIIASGALFLFMTNLLAIALTVTIMARWYGFGANHSPTNAFWQTGLIFVTFAALSLPLGLALTRIASQASTTTIARLTIQDFYSDTDNRISDFSISFAKGEKVSIDTIVLSRSYRPEAETALTERLAEALGRPVELHLNQVLFDQDTSLDKAELLRLAESSLAAPLQSQLAKYQHREAITTEIRKAASFKIDAIDFDETARRARLFPSANRYISLAAYREMETTLRDRFQTWTIDIVPPAQPLPPVFFEIGSSDLDTEAQAALEDISWALERWNLPEVLCVGYASSVGGRRFNNAALALARADSALAWLKERGLSGEATGEFRSIRQIQAEADYGRRAFHRVDVRLDRSIEDTAATAVGTLRAEEAE